MSSVSHLDLHLVINSRGLSGYQNSLEVTLIRKVVTGKLFYSISSIFILDTLKKKL